MFKEKLLAMPIEKQNALPYPELCALRSGAFTEHVEAMAVPQALKEWAALMQARIDGGVKVHHVVYKSWLVALMVVRYGEAIDHWPSAFSEDDVRRAKQWMEGKTPYGVSYPGQEGVSGIKMLGLLLAVVGGLLALWQDPAWAVLALPVLGSAMTNYLENKLADHVFRTSSFTKPTVLGHALFTAAPGETGGGTEVSGGSYARVDLPPLNTNWNATQGGTSGDSSGTGGLTDNAVDITFPAPSANWGTITHFAIFDATTAGNMLIYGALGTSKTVNDGDPAPKFPAGDLDITFA
ncbi:phage tail fiber protein [Candidatus Nitronereus thalassa]|uniref:Uncharacterized protein n=1 Tax=Candidatus Nitronereus thalassa TaxID=3020898 RepID=A0ABU3K379_9BACT|nr:hypothetical protein [Candidatus Nitronereus thalassa]MDT7040848.1 hypothetical protein [Candidatus Nitronereus thalassa]